MIRTMVIEDYEEVYSLWKKIQGFGIRSIDDSKEGVRKFLERNPNTSVSLIAFAQNDIGNTFWNTIGWQQRQDLNYYDFILNTENITQFNVQQEG